MADGDIEEGGSVAPGVGPTTPDNIVRRRPEPLWIVAIVIALPLIILAVIFIGRLLLTGH